MLSVNESFAVVGQYGPCPDVGEGTYAFNIEIKETGNEED
jgi:hypothetical protein